MSPQAIYHVGAADISCRHKAIYHCAAPAALGGDEGNRTLDPLLAGQVLSQLSYTPVCVIVAVRRLITWRQPLITPVRAHNVTVR